MLSLHKRLDLLTFGALMIAVPMATCSQKEPAQAASDAPTSAPFATGQAVTPPTVPSLGSTKDYLGDKTLERCRYFDSMKTVVEQIAGGPPITINISNYLADKVPADDTYRFDFIAYRDWNQDVWSMTFSGNAGTIPYHYTAYITNATTAYCSITAALDYTDLRTRLGCFAESTKIRMGSGEDRLIGLIEKGDLVFDPITKKSIKVVEIIKGPEHNPMYDITMGNQKVTVTQFHPFMTKNGLKAAKNLALTDKLLGADGIYHALKGYKKLPLHDGQVVYNIRLDDGSDKPLDHMVLANQVVTGDLFLQRQLQAKKQGLAGSGHPAELKHHKSCGAERKGESHCLTAVH